MCEYLFLFSVFPFERMPAADDLQYTKVHFLFLCVYAIKILAVPGAKNQEKNARGEQRQ